MANESTQDTGEPVKEKASSPPPSIAEKVRFWQEQDRINKAMIPRLVQLADQVGHLNSRIDEVESGHRTAVWKYAESLERRLAEHEKRLDEMLRDQTSQAPPRELRRLVWFAIAAAVVSLVGVIYFILRTVS